MDIYVYLYVAALFCAGLLSTRLMKKIKLPNVTGYIIIGIVMGPFVFGLFFNGFDFSKASDLSSPIYSYVKNLSWVSNVALGFIAFSIGSSFKASVIKQVGKKVIVITIFEALGGSLVVALALIILHFIWPDAVSLPLALTLGAIAAATAPAATLMVVKQYKANGPVTQTLLPVVALDDAAALILYAILYQIAKALALGNDFDLYEMLGKPVIEILISLGIGSVLGFIVSGMSRFFKSRTNRLIWIIATVFAALGLYYLFQQSYMGSFELSSLLICMAAGAIFANFQKEAAITFDFMDRFTSPIYMLFFVISGASLDLSVFASSTGLIVLALALIYAIMRFAGKWLGTFGAAKITRAEPAVQKYLGFCLVPQAGVAIGLASTASVSFGSSSDPKIAAIGSMVLAIVLTSTLIYEIVGPISTKIALAKAGEITLDRKVGNNAQ